MHCYVICDLLGKSKKGIVIGDDERQVMYFMNNADVHSDELIKYT
jgi:hypothetical protein